MTTAAPSVAAAGSPTVVGGRGVISKPSAASAAAVGGLDNTPLWDMNGPQVELWIRSHHSFFPKASLKPTAEERERHKRKIAIASILVKNLLTALTSVLPKVNNDSTLPPPNKRIKTEVSAAAPPTANDDPYHIWFAEADEIPSTEGGILAQLSIAALVNAMGGQVGGLMEAKTCKPKNEAMKMDSVVSTAGGITLEQLKNHYASALKRAISTRMDRDVLITTPVRIQQMLCPDVPLHEFKAARKRVYDTVILGKGMGNAAALQEDADDLPVAARTAVHDIEKFKKCKVCNNNDQSLFVMDRKNGDVICTTCGTVATESLMHEGSQYRKFEGEADRNHHGDKANPLMSNAHNMATSLGGMTMTSSAGNAWGTQSRSLETILRNAHNYTEMNISQFGKGERKTRVGYKDRQKRDAFIQMAHVGDALNLHEAVVQRAKELFAGFRDDRELVQQFKGVIAACLCEAFDQLSRDGRQILKNMEQEEDDAAATTDGDEKKGPVHNNARASRRSNLHSASMAGKGGLLLDFESVSEKMKNGGGGDDADKNNGTEKKGAAAESPWEQKPAATWDLEDCRSWLLEASRTVAQQWFDEGQKNEGTSSTKVPEGTLDELEGKLVEHTLTLCDQLETELKSRQDKNGRGKKVVTPRVEDMAQLGIKWQHSHERGSGGKGGVGNSGRTTLGTKPGERRSGDRTAGQILILKTAKKLGAMLKDPVSGDAFHRELRALVGRQEARKRKEMSDEATRQRFQQMKRKPWLQARAQVNT